MGLLYKEMMDVWHGNPRNVSWRRHLRCHSWSMPRYLADRKK